MSVNPKQQLTLIGLSTFLAGFSLASIVNFTDSADSSWVTFGFFYASLLIFCLGLFTLIGLGLRQKLLPGHYVINLSNSFRQGFFIAILIVASFVLLSKHLLFWWVEASLVLFLASLEAFLNLTV
jgi:hypothetical protein